MNLQTPLAKVRGLGSAGQGTHHWWQQRLTAIALIPLSLWFISSVIAMTTMDYQHASQWLAMPLNAVLMILFVISLFYHAQLGMQVVIEDYIDPEWQKITCVILVKFLAAFAGLISVLSVLKVFLGM